MYRIGMNEVPSYVSEGHIERWHEEKASREIATKAKQYRVHNCKPFYKWIVLKKIQ